MSVETVEVATMERRRSWSPAGRVAALAALAALAVFNPACRSADRGTASLPPTPPASVVSNPAASTPAVPVVAGRTVVWENVTFTLPATWLDYRGPGAFAAGPRLYDYRGYSVGRLNAVSGFDAGIDDLAPKVCLRPNSTSFDRPSAVTLVESGFAPVGDRTAQFRRWSATCPSGPEEHRAWVLPVSRIAIYEVCHDGDTVAVASTAAVAELTRPAPGGRPPWPNEAPGSCRNDLTDSATGT